MDVAAVARAVDQRPQGAGGLAIIRIATEKPRTDPEQNSPAQLQSVRYLLPPRERVKQRQPRIFESGQLFATDPASEKLRLDRDQPGFGRSVSARVERLEPLSPPGHSDRAEARFGRRRDHIGEGEIHPPEGRKGRS